MKWNAGQDFIDRLRFSVMDRQKYKAFKQRIRIAFGRADSLNPFDIHATHSIYGKIYYPYYNLSAQMGGGEIPIFTMNLARN